MHNDSEDDAIFFADIAAAVGGVAVAILYVVCVCIVVAGQCSMRMLDKWR